MTVVAALEARRAPESVPLLNLERVERVVVWMAAGGKGGRSPAQRTLDAGWQPVRRRVRVRPDAAADLDALIARMTTVRTARAWVCNEHLRGILERKQARFPIGRPSRRLTHSTFNRAKDVHDQFPRPCVRRA